MKILNVAIIFVVLIVSFTSAMIVLDAQLEVRMLRQQVREMECRQYNWLGRLETLEKINVRVDVIDASQVVHVDYVGDYREFHDDCR